MFTFEEDSHLTFMFWTLHSEFLFTKSQNINNAEALCGKSSDITLFCKQRSFNLDLVRFIK